MCFASFEKIPASFDLVDRCDPIKFMLNGYDLFQPEVRVADELPDNCQTIHFSLTRSPIWVRHDRLNPTFKRLANSYHSLQNITCTTIFYDNFQRKTTHRRVSYVKYGGMERILFGKNCMPKGRFQVWHLSRQAWEYQSSFFKASLKKIPRSTSSLGWEIALALLMDCEVNDLVSVDIGWGSSEFYFLLRRQLRYREPGRLGLCSCEL